MAYIGKEPVNGFHTRQSLTTNGSTTTFTLDFTIASSTSIIVLVGGVVQEPDVAYTLSGGGTSIVFSTAPSSSQTAYIHYLGQAIVQNLLDVNGAELVLDVDADTTIHADTDDEIDFRIGGSDVITFKATGIHLPDGEKYVNGTGDDLQLFHDGTNSFLTNSTGILKVATETSGIAVTIGHTTSEVTFGDNVVVTGNLTIGGTTNFGDFDISNVGSIALDTITNDGTDITLDSSGDIILDAGGNDIFFKAGGTTIGEFENETNNFIIKSSVSDADLILRGNDGGSEISALTFDMSAAGKATFNDQVVVGDGKLVLNATAVTSTAAELNLLDGVSGLVQADLTKLAALDATAAELNLLDGGTSATSTTIVDADRIILNDGGTMKQVAVSDLNTYTSSTIAADDVSVGDAAVNITTSSGNITIDAAASDSDIIFKGTDGSADTTYLTIDGSAAGKSTFNNEIVSGAVITSGAGLVIADAGNIGSASDTDAIAISSGGVVTMNQIPVFSAGINVSGGTIAGTLATVAQGNITSLGTLTTLTVDDITINGSTISDSGNFTIDCGADIVLDADGGDIGLHDDGTVFGSLNNNSGNLIIKSNTTTAITFTSANGVYAGNISTPGNILLSVDVDADDVSADSATGRLTLGAGEDLNLYHGGTHSYIVNDTGNLVIDTAGDLTFDAAGNDFKFLANGTEILNITNSSSDVIIKPLVDAKDIIFQQRDGTEVARIEDNATFNVSVDGKFAIAGTAVTSTAAELNHSDGVTSAIQTQMDTKASTGKAIAMAIVFG